MKTTFRSLLVLAVLLKAPCLLGCGSEEKPTTPQQLEEMRQRDLERAKAFQREG